MVIVIVSPGLKLVYVVAVSVTVYGTKHDPDAFDNVDEPNVDANIVMLSLHAYGNPAQAIAIEPNTWIDPGEPAINDNW